MVPGQYGDNEFFTFVEDVEPCAFDRPQVPKEDWWTPILAARGSMNLEPPARLVWLDCVSAPYFESLPWRDELCNIGDFAASQRRRRQILELDATKFLIVPLFLGESANEWEMLQAFGEADWHRVVIDTQRIGSPVLSAPDYDFGPNAALRYLRFEAECSLTELGRLRNVFNLNFIPNAKIEHGGMRGEPTPTPLPPKPTSKEKYIEYAPPPLVHR